MFKQQFEVWDSQWEQGGVQGGVPHIAVAQQIQ